MPGVSHRLQMKACYPFVIATGALQTEDRLQRKVVWYTITIVRLPPLFVRCAQDFLVKMVTE